MITATTENRDWQADHTRLYLEDGEAGHLVDFSKTGGYAGTPTLLLKTIGRKSGRELIAPLIYGAFGNEYAIIASKGGAPADPAWFLNIEAAATVAIQVIEDKFECTWRIVEGEERTRVWDAMVAIFPPFAEYQKKTARTIPVVLLKPGKPIASL